MLTPERLQEVASALDAWLALTLVALPVIVVERSEYEGQIPEAERRMRRRDPDDIDVLALVLHLALPV